MRRVAKLDRVAISSGQKTGKSVSAAVLALWWICTRVNGRVIMTSSSSRQVRDVLWFEFVNRWNNAHLNPLTSAKPMVTPENGLRLPDGRSVVGFSTDKPERMQGISGSELLYIVDEASGESLERVFPAIEGNLAGGGKMVLFSNPTRQSGYFFEVFNDDRKRRIWGPGLIYVSSEETPNFKTGRSVIPGLATKQYIEDRRIEYGVDSPWYTVRVLGQFAKQSSDCIFPLGLVDESQERWLSMDAAGPVNIGVDVARFGEDWSVICVVRGQKMVEEVALQGVDVATLADRVRAVANKHRQADEKPCIKVDVCGVGGGVADILRRDHTLSVIDINVAESATQDDKFPKLRDELWFAGADWMKAGGAILGKESGGNRLASDLVAPVYSFDTAGRRKVESKDDLRKRIGRSPDRADAFLLAVYGRGRQFTPKAASPRRFTGGGRGY